MRIIRLLLLTLLVVAVPATIFAQIGVSITIGPPALPVYIATTGSRARIFVDSRLLGLWP